MAGGVEVALEPEINALGEASVAVPIGAERISYYRADRGGTDIASSRFEEKSTKKLKKIRETVWRWE